MKFQKYIILSLLVSLTYGLQAQNSVKELDVNGLKVIFMPSSKATVSAAMFFRGGTANYAENQQGIEKLTLAATSECGTKKYTKDEFKDEADKYGVSINGDTNYDYGSISMSCVKPYFKEGWNLFVEAVNNPVFDNKELELLKQKLVAGLNDAKSDPDNTLENMCMQNLFMGTRYASDPKGTVETMGAFTQNEVKEYYSKLLNVNRMALVVVGNLTETEVKDLIAQAFGKLPSSSINPMPAAMDTKVTENAINVEKRQLATNYIQGMMGAPAYTSLDSYAYRLAFSILSNKLFEEVRTKRNLSYAPYSYATSGYLPYSIVYVTTTKPNEAVKVMVHEMDSLKNKGFTPVDLRDAKSEYSTSVFMSKQSNNSIAYSLGAAEMKGSWKYSTEIMDRINAVTLPQLQKAFAKYAVGIKWNYLGDDSLIDKAVFDKKVE